MRKLIIISIIASLLIISQASAASLPDTWQDAIKAANAELGFNYYKEYNKHNLKINANLATSKWGTSTKGSSNVDFGVAFAYGDSSEMKNGLYRYLGETMGGDDFSNIYFPMDAWSGGVIEDREWLPEPWVNSYTESLIVETRFDSPVIGDKYLKNIIKGLETYYPDKLDGRYKKTQWQKYVHVLQPPTQFSCGIGVMWHLIDGKPWYLVVPLAPSYIIKDAVTLSSADGCFLDYPRQEGTNMVTYIIRGLKSPITQPVQIRMRYYIVQNYPYLLNFNVDMIPKSKWGEPVFDDYVTLTPEKPYWIGKVIYPVPKKGCNSGVIIQTGDKDIKIDDGVTSETMNTPIDGRVVCGGTYTLSNTHLMDWLPWKDIEKDLATEFKDTKAKRMTIEEN